MRSKWLVVSLSYQRQIKCPDLTAVSSLEMTQPETSAESELNVYSSLVLCKTYIMNGGVEALGSLLVFVLVKFALILGSRLLVLLILGNQV
jgi:hypothetical protein